MKHLFFSITIFLLFLLNSSCNDCKNSSCPRLNPEEASWFPYASHDSLIFKNNENDSLLYFPIGHYGNGSNLYTPPDGDECNKYCVAGIDIYSNYYINNVEIFSCSFMMVRIKDSFYVIISPTLADGSFANHFDTHSYFDLRHAIKLDTFSVNGHLLDNVYHYTCYPQQEEVAETFVKKGIGLVKIVFRDGQEFELVEHIKAK